MAELTDAEFEAAAARGREKVRAKLRAVTARYDRETGRVVMEMANGSTHIFPARLAQELHGAGDDEPTGVVVDGAGFNLHWPALDADLLVAGVFGTREWMAREWARMAGSVAPATWPGPWAGARMPSGGAPTAARGHASAFRQTGRTPPPSGRTRPNPAPRAPEAASDEFLSDGPATGRSRPAGLSQGVVTRAPKVGSSLTRERSDPSVIIGGRAPAGQA